MVMLVVCNIMSSAWAHFKAHEVSFKVTHHTAALAQEEFDVILTIEVLSGLVLELKKIM